ncbi:EamA family transporter [Agromyces sp. MMS24-JH15]|uniref:EamA family transporter n=1 Tax=Agromyces sp. MMS24-JH15 TaxID=3243765 RepID=UPI003748D9BC
MLTAVLSLTGALVYGAADFVGGIAAKRISSILVTALGAASGLALLAVVVPFLGATWTPADLAWGAAAGVAGMIAIALLYACLAIGPMSILSPLTAVVSAITPMAWGLVVGGERFGALGGWALALALVAVVLVGFVPERGAVRPSPRGILMAIGSGIGIGAYYILISQTAEASGLVPLLATRSTTAVLGFATVGIAALVASRARARVASAPSAAVSGGPVPPATTDAPPRSPARTAILLALGAGLVDATANVLLLLGIRAGDLSVAAVLGALYPAGTILLAAIVLKERIAPVQWAGLALALAAAGMLALA